MRKPRSLYAVHVADYKVCSGYFGQFMYSCVVVHIAQHWGISTTGAFIVFQCENSLCSSYVGNVFGSFVKQRLCPFYCLVIQTQLTSAFITTFHSFSSVFMTDKTLSGTKKHHKSISINCLWNNEHDCLINIHPLMLSAVHCAVTVLRMRFQVLCISGASILWPPFEILDEPSSQNYAIGTKELRFTRGAKNLRCWILDRML